MPSCVLRASLRIACVFTHLHSHRDAYDDMNDADVLVFAFTFIIYGSVQ